MLVCLLIFSFTYINNHIYIFTDLHRYMCQTCWSIPAFADALSLCTSALSQVASPAQRHSIAAQASPSPTRKTRRCEKKNNWSELNIKSPSGLPWYVVKLSQYLSCFYPSSEILSIATAQAHLSDPRYEWYKHAAAWAEAFIVTSNWACSKTRCRLFIPVDFGKNCPILACDNPPCIWYSTTSSTTQGGGSCNGSKIGNLESK